MQQQQTRLRRDDYADFVGQFQSATTFEGFLREKNLDMTEQLSFVTAESLSKNGTCSSIVRNQSAENGCARSCRRRRDFNDSKSICLLDLGCRAGNGKRTEIDLAFDLEWPYHGIHEHRPQFLAAVSRNCSVSVPPQRSLGRLFLSRRFAARGGPEAAELFGSARMKIPTALR